MQNPNLRMPLENQKNLYNYSRRKYTAVVQQPCTSAVYNTLRFTGHDTAYKGYTTVSYAGARWGVHAFAFHWSNKRRQQITFHRINHFHFSPVDFTEAE